ncbi:MAG: hypothetical protein GY757_18130 [bacterium]|nr:hypothetical protein [bacterium]
MNRVRIILPLVMVIILLLMPLMGQTKNGTAAKKKSLPVIKTIKASSWDNFQYLNSFTYNDVWRQVDLKDFLLLQFEHPIHPDDVRKYLTVQRKEGNKNVPFTLSRHSDTITKVTFKTPLKQGALYQLEVNKNKIYFQAAPPFELLKCSGHYWTGHYWHSNKEICLYFSNPIDQISKENIAIYHLTSPTLPGGKRIKNFQIMAFSKGDRRIHLILPGKTKKTGKYIVEVSKGITNRFGQNLGKKVKKKLTIISPAIKPNVYPTTIKGAHFLALNNIKSLEYTLFLFTPDIIDFLKPYSDYCNMYGGNEVIYEPGLLEEKGILTPFIKGKKKVYIADTMGKKKHLIDFRQEMGTTGSLWGIMVNRFEPASTYNLENFYDYLNSGSSVYQYHSPFQLSVFNDNAPGFVVKTDNKKSLVWIYDNPDKEPPIIRLQHKKEHYSFHKSSYRDLYLLNKEVFKYRNQKSEMVIVENPKTGNYSFCFPGEWYYHIDGVRAPLYGIDLKKDEHFDGHLFTDRDYYLQGDTIHIGGMFKICSPSGLREMQKRIRQGHPGRYNKVKRDGLIITISLKNAKGKLISSSQIKTDCWGGFTHTIKAANDFKKGTYTITATLSYGTNLTKTFRLDYFQPNKFEVVLSGFNGKTTAASFQNCMVSGFYHSGTPMAGDKIEFRTLPLSLEKSQKLFTDPKFINYRFFPESSNKIKPFLPKGKKTLNQKGQCNLGKVFAPLKNIKQPAAFKLEVVGISSEGKEFKTSKNTIYFPGNKLIGIKLPHKSGIDEEIKASLAVVDSSGNWCSAEADITVYEERREGGRHKITVLRFEKKKFKNQDEFGFKLKETGCYIFECKTYDQNGETTYTSHRFNVIETKPKPHGKHVSLWTDKKSYKRGETGRLTIYSPYKSKILVTIERETILHALTTDAYGIVTLPFKIKNEYADCFKIKVMVYDGGQLPWGKELDIFIENDVKPLKVEIKPAAKKFAPNRQAKVRLKVTGPGGSGIKAKLIIYGVDEGNLSLTGYRTPDPVPPFLYGSPEWLQTSRTFYSAHTRKRFYFSHPKADVPLDKSTLLAKIIETDGSPLQGVAITMAAKNGRIIATTESSAYGFFRFKPNPLIYMVKFEKKGYVTYIHKQNDLSSPKSTFQWVMKRLKKGSKSRTVTRYCSLVEHYFVAGVLGGTVGGMGGFGPGKYSAKWKAGKKTHKDSGAFFRRNRQPLLFFKVVETNSKGRADVTFKTPDNISTYRLMAVAYNDTMCGSGDKRIAVTRNLTLTETMPEFAVEGDTFSAGARISNLRKKSSRVSFSVSTGNSKKQMTVSGRNRQKVLVKGKGNKQVYFDFQAQKKGEAEIRFLAESSKNVDAVVKTFPVLDRLVDDSKLYFYCGKTIEKKITIDSNYIRPQLEIKVSSTHNLIASRLSKLLFTYPYGCMEQRTSRVLPMLVLDRSLWEHFEVNMSPEKIKKAIHGYLESIPEFMTNGGGMAYYKHGEPSQYLTAYVIWALHMAKENGYPVEQGVVSKLIRYMKNTDLNPSAKCFLHYVECATHGADINKSLRLFADRKQLSVMSKIFLYKTMYKQTGKNEKTALLLKEIQQQLDVQDSKAYINCKPRNYSQALPFYNRRYMTALFLDAVLTVEGSYRYAPHMLNWLLDVKTPQWKTTQANVWILMALNRYYRYVMKKKAPYADIQVGKESVRKIFTQHDDTFIIKMKSDPTQKELNISVHSPEVVFVTIELFYKTDKAPPRKRGIEVKQNVFDREGRPVDTFRKGEIYQVELLVDADSKVPYGVVEAPLPAGFQLLRSDYVTTRNLKNFGRKANRSYSRPTVYKEHERGRTLYYSYIMGRKTRLVYYIKALYPGTFTWLPTLVRAMYSPHCYGRTATQTIMVRER